MKIDWNFLWVNHRSHSLRCLFFIVPHFVLFISRVFVQLGELIKQLHEREDKRIDVYHRIDVERNNLFLTRERERYVSIHWYFLNVLQLLYSFVPQSFGFPRSMVVELSRSLSWSVINHLQSSISISCRLFSHIFIGRFVYHSGGGFNIFPSTFRFEEIIPTSFMIGLFLLWIVKGHQ